MKPKLFPQVLANTSPQATQDRFKFHNALLRRRSKWYKDQIKNLQR